MCPALEVFVQILLRPVMDHVQPDVARLGDGVLPSYLSMLLPLLALVLPSSVQQENTNVLLASADVMRDGLAE